MTKTKPASAQSAFEAITSLQALMEPEYPMILSNDAPVIRIVASALLARAHATTDAIAAVARLRRQSDLAVLTRTLFEHVVVLAWLLAEPGDERVALWQRYDNEQRLKLHNDMKETDRQILTGENWLASKLQVLSHDKQRMPNIADCAEQADSHWASRLPGFKEDDPLFSFRGLYRTIYRTGSAFAHASLVGLNPIADRTKTHTVIQLEPQRDARPTLLMTPAIFGFALWMMGDVFGWPRPEDISSVFDRLRGEPANGN
jgi:hypothetical protein